MTPAEAIEVLKSSGLTEAAIASKVGASQSAVNKIRHGVMSPTYPLGKALVDWANEVQAGDLVRLDSAA